METGGLERGNNGRGISIGEGSIEPGRDGGWAREGVRHWIWICQVTGQGLGSMAICCAPLRGVNRVSDMARVLSPRTKVAGVENGMAPNAILTQSVQRKTNHEKIVLSADMG